MGSLVGYSILPKNIGTVSNAGFRNAEGTATSRGGNPSDTTTYSTDGLSPAQIEAREIHTQALEIQKSLEADKAVLAKLISDIKSVCNKKSTGWKNQVLALVKNAKFKGLEYGTIGVYMAAHAIIPDPAVVAIYAIVTAIKKKEAAEEICNSAYPSGSLGQELSRMDSNIEKQRRQVRLALYNVQDVDAVEAKYQQNLADNAARMNLAATASEREKYRQESERLKDERDSKLRELKTKQRSEEAALRMQRADLMNNKTLMVGGIVLLALGAVSYLILKGK